MERAGESRGRTRFLHRMGVGSQDTRTHVQVHCEWCSWLGHFRVYVSQHDWSAGRVRPRRSRMDALHQQRMRKEAVVNNNNNFVSRPSSIVFFFFFNIHRFHDDPSNDDEKHSDGVWIQCHMSDDINTMINAAAKPYWGWGRRGKSQRENRKNKMESLFCP